MILSSSVLDSLICYHVRTLFSCDSNGVHRLSQTRLCGTVWEECLFEIMSPDDRFLRVTMILFFIEWYHPNLYDS